ncbi:hypothetical protein KEJ27_08570 [Candidatus Bathyarchaeota archaeon]|nr:hypothetical protein [Candidatus Bathyarchaeota archaeon]MBS7617425.1 hypothetical protein [Candidatus Bathyarchaeota archaeon]
MVKVSINRFVLRRVERVRRDVEVAAQRLRKKMLRDLEEVFEMSARVVRGEVERRRIDGRMARITLDQRRKWLRVAEKAAKIIENISINIDEQEIYTQLDELSRLINEADTKAETPFLQGLS